MASSKLRIDADATAKERKSRVKEIVTERLEGNISKWARYIVATVKEEIKKKHDEGLVLRSTSGKCEISGAVAFKGNVNGYYTPHRGQRHSVRPCFRFPVNKELLSELAGSFKPTSNGEVDSKSYLNCDGVVVLLGDEELWCHKLIFSKRKRILFFFKTKAKPKSPLVASLVEKTIELAEAEGIKLSFNSTSGIPQVFYTYEY